MPNSDFEFCQIFVGLFILENIKSRPPMSMTVGILKWASGNHIFGTFKFSFGAVPYIHGWFFASLWRHGESFKIFRLLTVNSDSPLPMLGNSEYPYLTILGVLILCIKWQPRVSSHTVIHTLVIPCYKQCGSCNFPYKTIGGLQLHFKVKLEKPSRTEYGTWEEPIPKNQRQKCRWTVPSSKMRSS